MAKINDTTAYPNTTPALNDHVIGTDVSNTSSDPNGESVTFTFPSIMDLFEANMAAPASIIASGTFADARIAASNVTQHQAALTITESQISDLGAYLTDITGESIGSLSDVVLTSAAQGDILYRNATQWVNLGPGTSGHFLKTNGAGANPEWAAGAGGGISNVVEDTTPQLGGNLDGNGFAVTRDYTNDNAGTASKGAAVYIKSNGNVDLARANSTTTMPAVGLVAADILTTATGPVAVEGVLTNIDTSGLTAGEPVYVSSTTAGALTSTRPTANAQVVAYCEVSNATTGVLRLALSPDTFDEITDGYSFADTNGNEVLEFGVTASAVNHTKTTNAATGNAPTIAAAGGDTNIDLVLAGKGTGEVLGAKTAIPVAISSETDDLTTGTAKFSYHMPAAFELTDIVACVTTAPTGASIIIDVNAAGTSIMTTNKLEIEVSETSTESATTQPALTTTSLSLNQLITFDIDQVGSTVAGAGAKVTLIGYFT